MFTPGYTVGQKIAFWLCFAVLAYCAVEALIEFETFMTHPKYRH